MRLIISVDATKIDAIRESVQQAMPGATVMAAIEEKAKYWQVSIDFGTYDLKTVSEAIQRAFEP